MKRIKPGDEQVVLKGCWTQRDSMMRDQLIDTVVCEVLMPFQLEELSRMRRFQPGDKVRLMNLNYLHDAYPLICDKFIEREGGHSASDRDLNKFLSLQAERARRRKAEALA